MLKADDQSSVGNLASRSSRVPPVFILLNPAKLCHAGLSLSQLNPGFWNGILQVYLRTQMSGRRLATTDTFLPGFPGFSRFLPVCYSPFCQRLPCFTPDLLDSNLPLSVTLVTLAISQVLYQTWKSWTRPINFPTFWDRPDVRAIRAIH